VQEREEILESLVRRLAQAVLTAAAVAVAAGCASGVPALSARRSDAAAPGTYVGLGFKDLPIFSLESRKVALRLESSRRGLIKQVVKAQEGRLATELLSDAAHWCAENAGELVKSPETQEIALQIVDILGAEYGLAGPRNVQFHVCRAVGRDQTVLSAEGPEEGHQVYVVWMTDAEVSAARPTIASDRMQLHDREDARRANESRKPPQLTAGQQQKPSAIDEEFASQGLPQSAADNQRKLRGLDAEFSKLDQRTYRLLKEAGAAAPARNAATAASKVIADALGPPPRLPASADLEQRVGRANVARLGYFAGGACTLRAFRPYRQSAVDLRKVDWDVAGRSVHAIRERSDSSGTPIPGEGMAVVRFNLLGTAVDVDSPEDAARVLKAAQLIASACVRPD
jgi:hypothetical protein